MKRHAAFLCAILLAAGLCGCGCQKQNDTHPDTTTTTTPETTATTAQMKTPDAAARGLTYASPFSDGIAFVRYPDADGVEHTATIDKTGSVLFELPNDTAIESIRFQDGICVIGDVIYNKKGEVIASPEMSGYTALLTGNCGGYVLAKREVRNDTLVDIDASEAIVGSTTVETTLPTSKTSKTKKTTTTETTTMTTEVTTTTTQATKKSKKSTTDTEATESVTTEAAPAPTYTLEVGVLNKKGKWEHPLSADNPIAVAFHAATQPTENLTVVDNGVVMACMDAAGTAQYYHCKKNTLNPGYAHYSSANYTDEDAGIYKQSKNGSSKRIIENVVSDLFFKDAFIGKSITITDEGEIKTGKSKLYDYNGEVLMDLSDYTMDGNIAYYIDGYLVLPTLTKKGVRQVVVLDEKGKEAFDPIKLDGRDTLFAPDKKGFVVSHTTEEGVRYTHYTFKGKKRTYENVAAFSGFSDGLAPVTLVDGQICYINYKEEIVIQ